MRARALSVAVALLASGAPVASAAPPGSPAIGVLGKETILSGSERAMYRVHLSRRSTLAFPLGQRNRDLRVEGAGRFVGIVLVEENEKFDGATLIAGIVRGCTKRACRGKPFFLTNPLRERHMRVHLPAGDYRLFFLPDGAPATIRLRLHGVDQETALPPSEPVDITLETPTAHVTTGSDGPVFVAGETYRLASTGLIFNSIWLEGTPSGVRDLGTCRYRGNPPAEPAVAYSELCKELGAHQHRWTTASTATWYREGLLTFWSPLKAGRWSSGVFYKSTSAIGRKTGAWTMVLEYGR